MQSKNYCRNNMKTIYIFLYLFNSIFFMTEGEYHRLVYFLGFSDECKVHPQIFRKNLFGVTFDQFNVFQVNKSIHFLKNKQIVLVYYRLVFRFYKCNL